MVAVLRRRVSVVRRCPAAAVDEVWTRVAGGTGATRQKEVHGVTSHGQVIVVVATSDPQVPARQEAHAQHLADRQQRTMEINFR